MKRAARETPGAQALDAGQRKPREPTYRADMPYADWAAVTRDLATTLERLDDREFLILGEPQTAAGPPRGLFGRRSRPAPTRYVQVLRTENQNIPLGEIDEAVTIGMSSCIGRIWSAASRRVNHSLS